MRSVPSAVHPPIFIPSTLFLVPNAYGGVGTTMYRWGASFVGKDGMRIIQAGILDNEKVLNELKIDLEMFTVNRREWGVY